MLLRVLSLAAFVSVVGCGGGDLTEGAGSGALPEQEVSAQADTCESLQGKVCTPERETGCFYANGTQGECYCQQKPFNKWVCWPSS